MIRKPRFIIICELYLDSVILKKIRI